MSKWVCVLLVLTLTSLAGASTILEVLDGTFDYDKMDYVFPGEVVHRFDFGDPQHTLAPGYTRVGPAQQYTPGGWGWVNPVGLKTMSRLYLQGEMNRDHIFSDSGEGFFRVDLAPGTYWVLLSWNDVFPRRGMGVVMEGKDVLTNLEVLGYRLVIKQIRVVVTDGTLDIEFYSTQGGWAINSMVITRG